MKNDRLILSHLDKQTARMHAELNQIKRQREVLEKRERVRTSPAYRKLEAQRKEAVKQVHLIRLNLVKKRLSLRHRERDVKYLTSAIAKYAHDETKHVKRMEEIERQLADMVSKIE